jgi:AraC-like DNA-binding protein
MKEKISTVMGGFGRLSAGVYARPVGCHTYREPGVLFHMGGGDLGVTVDEITEPFRAGDMLMLDRWTAHSRVALSNEPSTLVTLLADPLLFGAISGSLGRCRFRRPRAKMDAELNMRLGELLILMFDRPDTRPQTIQFNIEQLIELVRERYVETGRSPRHAGDRVPDSRVLHAFECLRECAARKVSVESMVAESGMSRSHFFRQFKRGIGVSPQQVIDEARVDYALRALSRPGLMLSQLSAQLGFSAPAHFTRFFVQHLGCTPSQFRRHLLVV